MLHMQIFDIMLGTAMSSRLCKLYWDSNNWTASRYSHNI